MENNFFSDEFRIKIWNFYESNLSPRTRKEYYNVVKYFAKIVGHDPLIMNKKDADLFYKDLERKLKAGRLSYTTALMRLSVMRSVCEYIKYTQNNKGYDYINYFSNISLPDIDKTIKENMIPDISEVNQILKYAKNENDITAFVIFTLIIKCGIKSSEISNLNIEYIAIDSSENFCINFPAKNRTSRIIRLPNDVAELLNNYIDTKDIFEGPIFLNKRSNRIKVRDIERLLKKYVDIGISEKKIKNPFTTQSMRHAAFTYMLQGGASEDEVASYGGITTKWMSRYRHISSIALENSAAEYSIISIKSTLKAEK